ncbi:MAG: hypothetical protein OES79_13510, partial [Planctomycetota bacterium]|nr:hypothetical protein [Planctomycetota bacterium]
HCRESRRFRSIGESLSTPRKYGRLSVMPCDSAFAAIAGNSNPRGETVKRRVVWALPGRAEGHGKSV